LEFDISEYIDARDGSIKFAFLMGITPLSFISGVSKPQILKPET
jgi:hypothetical protein